ncbi:carbon-nitrogen family hydrolase [Salipaludibacillus aurantiacus]|uniref:Predicted amidohydrolase n=1 Tax=Salipaludibacillus aurantiacus TaxID=1601833 RepID=A0A1H9WA33_9BACI|nr:carbon-nitrogen family hydrolase [Salipaludibacillus aurantiacus]SES30695.1 Predicted amidohydrolase [Salipaludibacillus aurantiacus]
MGLKVALIQADIAYGDPEANYRKIEREFEKAAADHPDIIVLPELWPTGYDLARLDEIGDPEAEQAVSFLSGLTRKHQVNAVAGSVPKQTKDGTKNTMLVFDSSGRLVKEYSKAHLFRLMNEEKYLIQGNDNGLFHLAGHPSAGVICYDIRFPDWIRTHMVGEEGKQTKILYVVAEWPKARVDHWKALLISRAIENQCFVVACNRTGADPNNEFGGHSIVIGPWGEIIAEAGGEETILHADIEIEDVDKVRESIPVFTDRRPGIYKL